MQDVIVIKKNLAGEETWRYSGSILFRQKNSIVLSARFNRPDMLFHGILLAENDLFFEAYFSDRWYNIFEIHDKVTGFLKGWYCNVTYPAQFSNGLISYIDLALDLLVFPDGRQLVLDQDEFDALSLTIQAQQQALSALDQLQKIFLPPVIFCLQDTESDLYKALDL